MIFITLLVLHYRSKFLGESPAHGLKIKMSENGLPYCLASNETVHSLFCFCVGIMKWPTTGEVYFQVINETK